MAELEHEITLLSFMHLMVKSADAKTIFPLVLQIMEETHITMTQDILNGLFGSLCSEDIGRIEEFLRIMTRDLGFLPSTRTLNIIVQECTMCRDANAAVLWFEKFTKDMNVIPNVSTMNIFLRMFSELEDSASCVRWYKTFTNDFKITPDPISVQTLFFSCSKANDIVTIFQMLKDLRQSMGVEWSSRSLGSIIQGASTAGDMDSIERWMEVATKDLRIVPNLITINSVINGYAKRRNWKMAAKWFDELSERFKLTPNAKSMGALLQAYVGAGAIVEAEKCWKKLIIDRKYEPNIVMFNTLLSGYQKFGTTAQFSSWLDDMPWYQLHPSSATIGMALQGFAKARDTANVEKWLSVLESTGRVGPDRRHIWAAFDCICKQNKIDLAKQWMVRLNAVGIEPDVVIFTTVIDSFARRGIKSNMMEEFKSMLTLNIKPNNFTVNSLVKGFVRHKTKYPLDELKELKKLLIDMKKNYSISFDSFTYYQLLMFCDKCKHPKYAVELFDELLVAGVVPTAQLMLVLRRVLGDAHFKSYCEKYDVTRAQMKEVLKLEDPMSYVSRRS